MYRYLVTTLAIWLFAGFVQPCFAQSAAPEDARRALPNNPSPPERLVPRQLLPVHAAVREGAIRRVHLPQGEKICALTFDLCELATVTTGYDAQSLGLLQKQNIPATLFMGGKWMRTHALRVNELLAEPLFEIASHAWAHGNFGLLTAERMKEEILWPQAQYELMLEQAREKARAENDRQRLAVLEKRPNVPVLFRFPYGRYRPDALAALSDLGLEAIQWDVVAESTGPNNLQGQAVAVARQVRSGSILLFHANLVPRHTFELLSGVVAELKKQGYTFVTVSHLLSLGTPERAREGYFLRPGDNLSLDSKFGKDGTGRK